MEVNALSAFLFIIELFVYMFLITNLFLCLSHRYQIHISAYFCSFSYQRFQKIYTRFLQLVGKFGHGQMNGGYG